MELRLLIVRRENLEDFPITDVVPYTYSSKSEPSYRESLSICASEASGSDSTMAAGQSRAIRSTPADMEHGLLVSVQRMLPTLHALLSRCLKRQDLPHTNDDVHDSHGKALVALAVARHRFASQGSALTRSLFMRVCTTHTSAERGYRAQKADSSDNGYRFGSGTGAWPGSVRIQFSVCGLRSCGFERIDAHSYAHGQSGPYVWRR